MFTQRKHTVVIITDSAIARVDLLAGNKVEVIQTNCASRSQDPDSLDEDLSTAVEDALSLGDHCWGDVWVLATEFWSELVSLSREVVRAVDQDQLTQSLAFEIETESGICPFDSMLSHVAAQTSDRRKSTWWVTQLHSGQFNEIQAATEYLGYKLAGLAAAATNDSDAIEPLVIDADSLSGTPEVGDGDASEWNRGEWNAGEAQAAQFAASWLDGLLGNPQLIPVIKAARQTLTTGQRKLLTATSLVVALATCFATHAYGTHIIHQNHSELERLVEQNVRWQNHVAENQSLHDRKRELTIQYDEDRRQKTLQQTQRQQQIQDQIALCKRPAELLHALSVTARDQHWIQSIELNAEHAVISGLAIDSHAIAELSQGLELDLGASKWRVQPARMSIIPSTSLLHFEISLIPRRARILTRPIAIENSLVAIESRGIHGN